MASGVVISKIIAPGQPNEPIPYFVPGLGVVQMETKDLDLGSRTNEKMLDALKFQFDDEKYLGAVVIVVGTRNHFNADIVWSDSIDVNEADQPVFLDLEESRYFRIRLTDNLPFGRWKLKGIDFYGMVVGGKL